MNNDGGHIEFGLHESPITTRVARDLDSIDQQLVVRRELKPFETPDRVALHLRREIERALESVPEGARVEAATTLVATVLSALMASTNDPLFLEEVIKSPAEVLSAITKFNPDGSTFAIPSPLISLLDTTLLTPSSREPSMGHQLLAEIGSASRIDVLVAFVRRSGLREMKSALRRHCEGGGQLRVLTTTYTGSTEKEALDWLIDLGAEVRVSYDESRSRLHAKAWLFERFSGFSTAYVGSSNLTDMAMNDGLEWNLRISAVRNPDVVRKIEAVFNSYWQNESFRDYDPVEFLEHQEIQGRSGSFDFISPLQIVLRPFQERLLELVAVERNHGHHKNLVVAATGTGKTVMAAVDYVRLANKMKRARLLFIAHRKEILEQSRSIFRQATRDGAFGEMWQGGQSPRHFDHVFASVQTLDSADLAKLDPFHFDVVIVDEFHHSAAKTYKQILEHLKPIELVGLTATPERADGESILHWFDDRIAAELRLWDAIDQGYLSPFHYYGINDGLDLREVPWKRGSGYDIQALTNVITSNDIWARRVIHEYMTHVDDPLGTRALGFCVSVDHAEYMAEKFNAAGINAVAISGKTSQLDREKSLHQLARGVIQIIFSVDIFSEGVDVPNVDTLLMLRPTESATIFLQQLGRGLRTYAGKSYCVVLDFIGIHRAEFRFDLKYRALFGGSRLHIQKQVKDEFPFLPVGCRFSLDPVAQQVVLNSIRSAIPSSWPQRIAELKALSAENGNISLAEFLNESGLELEDVYGGSHCWSELRESAGLATLGSGEFEPSTRKAISRLLHVNDLPRLGGWALLLRAPDILVESLTTFDQRLLRMLLSQLFSQSALDKNATLQDGADALWQHPQIISELLELFEILEQRIDHLQFELAGRPTNPLMIHGRYSSLEILAAFGDGVGVNTPTWREGVKWLSGEKADVFVMTLDKSNGGFSPTTLYRDYAISPELIHWESQNKTSGQTPVGRRYQNHSAEGSEVFLFARLNDDVKNYWFLGPARYVSHVGDRPMAITWKLDFALPGDLYAQFAAAVA